MYSDLQRSGKLSDIDYLKKDLEIDKKIYEEVFNDPNRPKDKREILLEKVEVYKGLYGEYPKIGNLSEYHEDQLKIKEIEEMINQKIKENQGK